MPISFEREGVAIEAMVRLTGVHSAEKLTEMIEGPVSETEKPETPEKPETEAEVNQYASWYEERRGFTNYHFNKLNRKRVWDQSVESQGDFSSSSMRWRLSGVNNKGKKVQMVLADEKSGIEIGSKTWVLDPESEMSEQRVPEDTGGLLIALHLWRNFLILGPERFGEVVYFGSAPLEPGGTNYQILVATRGTIESHLFFHPETGKLTAMEIFPELNSDPCLLWLKDYRRDDDLSLPATMEYSFGIQSGKIEIEKLEFLK